MEIITARPEHAAVLASLNDPVQKLHADNYPNLFKYPINPKGITDFFKKQLLKVDSRIFLAEIAGEAIGYIWCTIDKRPDNPFKFGYTQIYIHQMSANPQNQGDGMGQALMQAAEELAVEHDAKMIVLDSWVFNSHAHHFFEKMGYSKFNIRMWKTV